MAVGLHPETSIGLDQHKLKRMRLYASTLVPLDGSQLAESALNEAIALAELPDSTVYLLQVVSPIEDVTSDGETFTIDQRWDRRKARAEAPASPLQAPAVAEGKE